MASKGDQKQACESHDASIGAAAVGKKSMSLDEATLISENQACSHSHYLVTLV